MSLTLPKDPLFTKLENVFGKAKAAELVDEVCRERAIASLDGPNDRFAFGEALVSRGGLLEMIGRAIKVQAILHGARAGR
jgi:hypothetical protein